MAQKEQNIANCNIQGADMTQFFTSKDNSALYNFGLHLFFRDYDGSLRNGSAALIKVKANIWKSVKTVATDH